MRRSFATLDVFTDRALAGNPLAVVLEAGGLDDAEMQAIASEFNLSETVFVLPPRDPVNTAAIRIFTPDRELPFAGHPTVGTGVLLGLQQANGELGRAGGVVIALEEKIGLVRVEVSRLRDGRVRGVFEVPRLSERLPASYDEKAVAAALGLAVEEIGLPGHAVSLWTAGVPYICLPLRDRAAVAKARPGDIGAWRTAFGAEGWSIYLYTTETENPAHHVHARMFWIAAGLREDPATGSAAAAFAGAAAAFEKPADGTHQLIIEQGYEMGRPSEIALDLVVEQGRLAAARIGGGAVLVSEGTLISG